MRTIAIICLTTLLIGCAGLPDRTYSFSFTDASQQTVAVGVHLGATVGIGKAIIKPRR